MNFIVTVAESPVSAILAGIAVAGAICREVALASSNGKIVASAKATLIPFLVLLVVFTAIVISRFVLIFQ